MALLQATNFPKNLKEKFKVICKKKYDRSMASQFRVMVRHEIEEYEAKFGEINLEKSDQKGDLHE